MAGASLRLRLPGGPPVRAALCGTVLAEIIAVLPAQIRWADAAGLRGADPDDTLLALRALTVSPTLLHGVRTGLTAAVHEAAWAVLFLGLLLSAAHLAARRSARPPARPLVFALALMTFAPLANLAALLVRSLPQLAFEPALRGMNLARLLDDAQEQSAHAAVLALAGIIAVVACEARLSARRKHANAPSADDRTTDPAVPDGAEPGSDGNGPVPARSPLRQQLLSLRGPEETLRRRIGATLLAVCCAALFLKLLTSDAAEALLRWPAGALCAYATAPGPCAEALASTVTTSPPGEAEAPQGVLLVHATVYALQGFALSFAVPYFVLRAQRDVRNTPAATLLAVWAAYTTGAVTYGAVLDQATGLAFGFTPTVAGLLIPPSALGHTLLAAPFVGAVFALGTWIRARLGTARRRDGSTPPETAGGPDAPAVRPGPTAGSTAD